MSKSDLRIKSYGPGKFKQQYLISVQVSPGFLPENDLRLYINLILHAKEGTHPQNTHFSPKTREKFPKTMDPELGRFDPFSGQSGFSRGRRFRPPSLHTRWPGRKSKVRRPCRPKITANHRRMRPDRAGERGSGRHLGSSDFTVFRPFQTDPYLPPPIFGPSELIPVVLFRKFLTI